MKNMMNMADMKKVERWFDGVAPETVEGVTLGINPKASRGQSPQKKQNQTDALPVKAGLSERNKIMSRKLKPPMRYPGAKIGLCDKAIIPAIAQFVPDGCVYVEPFAGGGSTVCQFVNCFNPRKIVVNDIDPAVAAVWRCIANGNLAEDLAKLIKDTPVSVEELGRQKLALQSDNTTEKAFARLYQGWTTFRGKKDAGPVGGKAQDSKWDRIDKFYKPGEISARVLDLHDALGSKLEVRNEDFEHLIKEFDQPGAVIYLDPPYYEVGDRLYDQSLSDDDHVRLAELVKGVKKAFVVLSYGDHPRIRELYRGVEIKPIEKREDICSNGRVRKTTPEILMMFNESSGDHLTVDKSQIAVVGHQQEVGTSCENANLRKRLEEAEQKIQVGLLKFVEVGRELRRIRDERLYRGADDATFEDYIQRRWKMTRAHAYRFIKAAECYEDVSKLETTVLPVNEAQVRPMTSLSASERRTAWQEARRISGGNQPTSEQVSNAVAKVTGKEVEAPKKVSRVVTLASAMRKLGYDATLSLRAAGIADEYMQNAVLVEGDDDLNDTFSFSKLAQVLEGQVERRLSDEDADEDETECFLEAVRRHAELLLAKVEKKQWLRTVKRDDPDLDLSVDVEMKESNNSGERFSKVSALSVA